MLKPYKLRLWVRATAKIRKAPDWTDPYEIVLDFADIEEAEKERIFWTRNAERLGVVSVNIFIDKIMDLG